MKKYEIRLFKDKEDYKNRITCFCKIVITSLEEANKKAKELAIKFNVIFFEVEELY